MALEQQHILAGEFEQPSLRIGMIGEQQFVFAPAVTEHAANLTRLLELQMVQIALPVAAHPLPRQAFGVGDCL